MRPRSSLIASRILTIALACLFHVGLRYRKYDADISPLFLVARFLVIWTSCGSVCFQDLYGESTDRKCKKLHGCGRTALPEHQGLDPHRLCDEGPAKFAFLRSRYGSCFARRAHPLSSPRAPEQRAPAGIGRLAAV